MLRVAKQSRGNPTLKFIVPFGGRKVCREQVPFIFPARQQKVKLLASKSAWVVLCSNVINHSQTAIHQLVNRSDVLPFLELIHHGWPVIKKRVSQPGLISKVGPVHHRHELRGE